MPWNPRVAAPRKRGRVPVTFGQLPLSGGPARVTLLEFHRSTYCKLIGFLARQADSILADGLTLCIISRGLADRPSDLSQRAGKTSELRGRSPSHSGPASPRTQGHDSWEDTRAGAPARQALFTLKALQSREGRARTACWATPGANPRRTKAANARRAILGSASAPG
jgi:hypothetical protein